MVAEVFAVEPHVSDIANCAELEQRVVARERGRHIEVVPVVTAGDAAVGRRIERAGHADRRPARIVVDDATARTEIGCHGAQRALAIGQAGGGVKGMGLEAPRSVEVGHQTRLPVKGGHRLARLERDDASGLVLQGERRSQIRLTGGGYEAATRHGERKHQAGGEDDRSPEDGHDCLQGTRARLFGRRAPH